MSTLLPASHTKGYRAKISDGGRFSSPDLDPGSCPANEVPIVFNYKASAAQQSSQNADNSRGEQAPIDGSGSMPTQSEPAAPHAEPEEDQDNRYVEAPRPDYDDYGEELGKNAQFWKTYVREASRWDADMVDGWNK
ncbi:hypothetical protein FRC09_013279 [Ceratobasidium sp. 395]|nr:hypothetical protein FRC09_013279 [Ceratobasidium sp. 395]